MSIVKTLIDRQGGYNYKYGGDVFNIKPTTDEETPIQVFGVHLVVLIPILIFVGLLIFFFVSKYK